MERRNAQSVNTISQHIRIALISSVKPSNTSAGQLILNRHLTGSSRIRFYEPPNLRSSLHPLSLFRRSTSILKRLGLADLSENLLLGLSGAWYLPEIKTDSASAPDLILTIAHGDLWHVARRYSANINKPLVTIFHDWWPLLPNLSSFQRYRITLQFRRLYQASNLALCVSPGMLSELGPHSNAHVLYPIPSFRTSSRPPALSSFSPSDGNYFKVIYSGNLDDYGGMILSLLSLLENHPYIRFEVRGPLPQWPSATITRLSEKGLLLPFAPTDSFHQWISQTNAFLVPQVFHPSDELLMRTNFPSKIPEMSQYGKPIVVWGPKYASGVLWAQSAESGLCVCDPNPSSVVAALENLATSSSLQVTLGTAALIASNRDFNPLRIQSRFEGLLAAVCGHSKSDSMA